MTKLEIIIYKNKNFLIKKINEEKFLFTDNNKKKSELLAILQHSIGDSNIIAMKQCLLNIESFMNIHSKDFYLISDIMKTGFKNTDDRTLYKLTVSVPKLSEI